MEENWTAVHKYLSEGLYPEGYSKSQRQNLRRYSKKFTLRGDELFVGQKRAIRSKEDAQKIFKEFHSTPMGGHSGIIKTRSAICSRFYWKGMSIDIDIWVLECDKCQTVGKPLATSDPLQCIKVSAVWELVGMDLKGPLPKTGDGFQYILTATDYFSKWVEAFPMKTKTAAEVGRHICSIIYRHGCPKRILSDEGRDFVNDLNRSLCKILGIERSVTAVYHPRTNGLDVKTNHNIKRALIKLVNERRDNWDVFLEATLFSLRSKIHTTTKHTPFMLMYGREPVIPSQVTVDIPLSTVVLPDANKCDEVVQEQQKAMKIANSKAADNIANSQESQRQRVMPPKKKARVTKTTASSGKHDFGETASAAGKKRKAVASVGKNEEGSKSAGSADHSLWLMKSEPESRFENGIDVKFGIEDLKALPDQTSCWDGVRNYQARNFMRQMKGEQLAFFYHSNCKDPGIAGIMKIVKEAYVDHTQFDKKDVHYDASSKPDNPKWSMVDVRYQRMMKRFLPLSELKKYHLQHRASGGPLKDMALFTRARLSVQPLASEEFNFILSLEDKEPL
ncbi:uncharacterized protein PAE49_010515 [Odontesthes bonariensis]|uniref:uncharacterized protein LOC142388215 n=1 Tax=Odontesthes bonariensis TaxID=219752 RepID=UPI003F58ABA2